MARPQTIQIYLPFGEPQGIRQAELTTRTVRAFDVPRADLKKLAEFDEATQPGLYVLIGEDDNGDQLAYIGESDSVHHRLRTHNASEASGGKDFWQRAVVFVSLTNAWTKAHVRYLERLAFERAQSNGSLIRNTSLPAEQVYLPPPLIADCTEYFETIEVLLSTLGYQVLREKQESRPNHAKIYTVRRVGKPNEGYYSHEGMVVREGSYARVVENGAAEHRLAFRAAQTDLLQRGIVELVDGYYKFTTDYVFRTPSAASGFLSGSASNGWTDWIDRGGRTLSQNERD